MHIEAADRAAEQQGRDEHAGLRSASPPARRYRQCSDFLKSDTLGGLGLFPALASVARGAMSLGLALGNTCSTMAVMRQGALHVIANEQGSRSTPSCVAFSDGETLVGEAALGQVARNPRHTVIDLLLMLGRAFDDPVIQSALARWRFAACAAEKDGTVAVEAPAGKVVGALRLLSLLVAELRAAADAYIGSPVKEVVLAIPPSFSPARADALVEAARAGGMRVKSALPSPLAVALLYLSEHEQAGGARRVLVVDVGGSSTSVCVVDCDVDGGDAAQSPDGSGATRVCRQLRRLSLASCVSEEVGGSHVDEKLVAHALRDLKRRSRVDLADNARALARLRAACESGKRSLCGGAQTQIAVEADGVDYFVSVNRANLDELAKPLCQAVRRLVLAALGAAGSAPPVGDAEPAAERARAGACHVSDVLLAGGGCRMACVQAAVAAVLPDATVHFGGSADESVAKGAALYAAAMAVAGHDVANRGVSLHTSTARQRRLPCTIGLELGCGGHLPLVAAHAALPLRRVVFLEVAAPAPGQKLVLRLVEWPPRPVSDEATAGDASATGGSAGDGVRRVASLALAAPTERTIWEDDTLCLALSVHVSSEGELTVECVARPAEAEIADTRPVGMIGRVLGALNLAGTSDSAADVKTPQMLGSCRAMACATAAS